MYGIQGKGGGSGGELASSRKGSFMRPVEQVLSDIRNSGKRRRFQLREQELAYLRTKGLSAILAHALDFIEKRLAPAYPPNDGQQTPYGKHPVFVAQHATATCCRGCLQAWHKIPRGKKLDEDEKQYVLQTLSQWLKQYAE